MANITRTENQLWKDTCDATARKFNTVPNGKGSAWRTLPTDTYYDNYDEIFGKKQNNKTTPTSSNNTAKSSNIDNTASMESSKSTNSDGTSTQI